MHFECIFMKSANSRFYYYRGGVVNRHRQFVVSFRNCNSEGECCFLLSFFLYASSTTIDLDCEVRHEIHIEFSDDSKKFFHVFFCDLFIITRD